MISTVALVSTALALTSFGFYNLLALLRNLAQARKSGFPYLVLPFSPFSLPWLCAQAMIVPLSDRLPPDWIPPRLSILLLSRTWHYGYSLFARINADEIMLVSPGGNILMTCNPTAAHQILRDESYGKPAELLSLLNIFGPTITGTDGWEARLYRKITSPFFHKDTINRVWTKSVAAASDLMQVANEHSRDLRPSLAKLSLHIVNEVCFESTQDCLEVLRAREDVPPGHQLSYSHAMADMLDHFPMVFLTPPLILAHSPLPVHRRAYEAYNELVRYMEDLHDKKKREIQDVKPIGPSSLLDLIVQASEEFNQTSTAISSPAVLGNIFLFMFAGHEANANTLNFIIILLACHPGIQTALQADVDRILGAAPPGEWSLDAHYPALATSHVGAVINEALRLFTVLQFIPKRSPATPHLLPLRSKNHVIPADTLILINTSAIHRHPDIWPSHSQSSDTTLSAYGSVNDFNPGHWLHPPADNRDGHPPDQFLKPIPGGYLPFSDGNRGCLGKRFALVELVALVTRIFKEYSVELIIDCHADASDETRSARWRDAREAAVTGLARGVEFKMSLRMTGEVPVRFVRRDNF